MRMQPDCARMAFRKPRSAKRLRHLREWMIMCGEVETRNNYNPFSTKLGENHGLHKRLCPGESPRLKRFTRGYAGAISPLIRRTIGSKSKFQYWGCSAN